MKDQSNSHRTGSNSQRFGLRSSIILFYAVSSCFVCQNVQSAIQATILTPSSSTKNLGNDEIFSRYRPLAMDESWTVVKRPLVGGDGGYLTPQGKKLQDIDDIFGKPLIEDGDMRLPIPSRHRTDEDPPDYIESIDPITGEIRPKSLGLVDIETGVKNNMSVKDNLFALPTTGSSSSALTKLITGKDSPTLVHNGVVAPVSIKRDKGKILASYKILVPIFLPALKKTAKTKTKSPSYPIQPVKYIKETHTEMVPIRKNVVLEKTVLKAEPVSQKVITDFVKADGNSVPSSVDDKLKPNEKLLKSVVTNY